MTGSTRYQVFTDDNFHLHDESERDLSGTFSDYESALAAAKGIVDESLRFHYQPGMTAEMLYDHYIDFGVDPFIRPDKKDYFSAWKYAESRAAAIVEEMSSRDGS